MNKLQCFGCIHLQDVNFGTNGMKDIEEYICDWPNEYSGLFGNYDESTLWIDNPEERPIECPLLRNKNV